MKYQKILEEIEQEVDPKCFEGEVASYIPELSKVNSDNFGMHLCSLDSGNFAFGSSNQKFSIQSISKVFTLTMAFMIEGDDLWKRVGIEPSGNPFNSLVQLEYENGIPRNPLINAGALVVCDVLLDHLKNPNQDFLDFMRKTANVPTINFDTKVANSEKAFGHRNTALVNLMKSFGNIKNDPAVILDFYFHNCAVAMTCSELAKAFLLFANHGTLPHNKEKLLSVSHCKRLNSIMQLCGFYDEAGEFSFKVGLPGKSGVGGGIAAIHPGKYSVAVWSPKLNKKGNSAAGMKALELLTTKLAWSIF